VATVPDGLSASADETPETAQAAPPAQEVPEAQAETDGDEEKDS
jgi:hypothetical protein